MRVIGGPGRLQSLVLTLAAAARRCAAVVVLAALAGCGASGTADRPKADRIVSRVITADLWSGTTAAHSGSVVAGDLPRVDLQTAGGLSIQGPVEVDGPPGSGRVRAYMRTTSASDKQRLQLIAVTQGGAGLGRVRDMATGLPDRHFAGDVVFPLGLWKQGEIRQFEATEFTVAGPARRLVTLEIMDLDFVYEGTAHSLAYRLTIRDAANRVIDCETSVYSPGAGLVRFDASSGWSVSSVCTACPCPE